MTRDLRRTATMAAAATAAVLGAAVLTGAGAAAAATQEPTAAATAASATTWGTAKAATWGTAKEVPGSGALNKNDYALVNSVSCASAGNCSAGGQYTNINGRTQAFVAGETNGTWGTAKEVPGIESLNHGVALIASVSCTSAGTCGAGGQYTASNSFEQVFVVSETKGTWGTAKEVPGIGALNKGETAHLTSVSCGSAGNCGAGGWYTDAHGHFEAFVVSEKNGTWGTAKEVPGTAALNTGGFAETLTVSCTSAGNCSAGGWYTGATGAEAFVVSERKGGWSTAEEVPGTAALNTGGVGEIASVSCTTAGNCSAGGFYADASGYQPFVVAESNGAWLDAKQVPGIEILNKDGDSQIASVSCASAGNCSASGYYLDAHHHFEAFAASETGGAWRAAQEVAGALNKGGSAATTVPTAEATSVSCASAGNCSAGGFYTNSSGKQQAFVVSQTIGIWGTAQEVPGTAALNKGGKAAINSISCASASHCSGGGNYADKAFPHAQAFVVNRT